jgi:hypothetical protein
MASFTGQFAFAERRVETLDGWASLLAKVSRTGCMVRPVS